jgi:S-DNA-T family DNA segregation ATPase FtsK/SpoIIIE
MPVPPAEPPRTPFPLIASVAPLVASGVIWAVTGSALVLVFAALGPVIMVATLLDGRRSSRRKGQTDAAAYRQSLHELSILVAERHGELRRVAWHRTPAAAAILSGGADGTRWRIRDEPTAARHETATGRPTVTLGSGSIPSGVQLDMALGASHFAAAGGEELAQRASDVRATAATLTAAPVTADLIGGVGLVGPQLLVRAAARGLLIQAAHALPPDRAVITVPVSWRWAAALPHQHARAPAWEVVLANIWHNQPGGTSGGSPAPNAGAHGSAPGDPPEPEVGLDAGQRNDAHATGAPTRLLIALAEHPDDLPDECATLLRLHGPQRAEILRSPSHESGLTLQPELVSECDALAAATALGDRARHAGLVNPPTPLPQSVTMAELLPHPAPTAGTPQRGPGAAPTGPGTAHTGAGTATRDTAATPTLDCPIGRSEAGPVSIDLVRDGPHAVIGGTTGSGKSELLVSWVASMAARYRPTEVTFLLVDFKGGAAFAPLQPLPHCVGLITDLDQREAARALASLRAELRYREQLLRATGARDLTDAAAAGRLPRLVIVVDEFQAMLDSFPDLHTAFVDIAARGRSLGIHLVLCTQRPSGVVRDALLANCSLRLSLRVNNRADSQAVIGTDAAASLAASAPGRCMVASAAAAPTLFQVAVTVAADIRAIAAAARSAAPATAPPRRPWLDPLPARIDRASLLAAEAANAGDRASTGSAPRDPAIGRHASSPPGLLLGLVDEPALQRRRVARYDPRSDGSLLVVGGPGSGKSTLLAELSAESGATVVPPEVDTAWDALVSTGERHNPAAATPRLLLFDDFDSVLARWEPEYQVAALDFLTGILRDGRASGLHCVVALQRLTPPLRPLLALCQSALLLRLPTRDDYLAAGGADALWDPDLPAGGGIWQHARIQLVADDHADATSRGEAGTFGGESMRTARPFDPAPALKTGQPLIVISAHPGATAARLRAPAGGRPPDVVDLVSSASGRVGMTDARVLDVGAAGSILVGDPDAWQSNWSLLAALRTRVDLVFDQCSLADYRLVARRRDLPPALAPGRGQVWVLSPDGGVRRATLS